ncbi:hypothetical protein GCM10010293_39960 [Streptomyces griseoflavus]|nr:hypothetical protein [Streptomyces griseoflavus]GGV36608.1 hypothetical protein GCM10010293_39960 [Streptomyces griseoflavus]
MTPTEPAADTPRRHVPAWITNPDLIADIEAGHIDIDDDLTGDRNG